MNERIHRMRYDSVRIPYAAFIEKICRYFALWRIRIGHKRPVRINVITPYPLSSRVCFFYMFLRGYWLGVIKHDDISRLYRGLFYQYFGVFRVPLLMNRFPFFINAYFRCCLPLQYVMHQFGKNERIRIFRIFSMSHDIPVRIHP